MAAYTPIALPTDDALLVKHPLTDKRHYAQNHHAAIAPLGAYHHNQHDVERPLGNTRLSHPKESQPLVKYAQTHGSVIIGYRRSIRLGRLTVLKPVWDLLHPNLLQGLIEDDDDAYWQQEFASGRGVFFAVKDAAAKARFNAHYVADTKEMADAGFTFSTVHVISKEMDGIHPPTESVTLYVHDRERVRRAWDEHRAARLYSHPLVDTLSVAVAADNQRRAASKFVAGFEQWTKEADRLSKEIKGGKTDEPTAVRSLLATSAALSPLVFEYKQALEDVRQVGRTGGLIHAHRIINERKRGKTKHFEQLKAFVDNAIGSALTEEWADEQR